MKPNKTRLRELGELLTQCRADRNLKLDDVRQATGLAISWLSDLEAGKKSSCRRTSVLRLEKFLRQHGYFPKKAA